MNEDLKEREGATQISGGKLCPRPAVPGDVNEERVGFFRAPLQLLGWGGVCVCCCAQLLEFKGRPGCLF